VQLPNYNNNADKNINKELIGIKIALLLVNRQRLTRTADEHQQC
jgi:hypothetical protein